MIKLSSHLKLPCVTNTIPIYSDSFQVDIQVSETVIRTGLFSRYYNNARTSRYLNKYKGGWEVGACWFCFHNAKASITNLLKFWWRHQNTYGWGLSDPKFQFPNGFPQSSCTINKTLKENILGRKKKKKLLIIPVLKKHSIRITELKYIQELQYCKKLRECPRKLHLD